MKCHNKGRSNLVPSLIDPDRLQMMDSRLLFPLCGHCAYIVLMKADTCAAIGAMALIKADTRVAIGAMALIKADTRAAI